MLDRHIELLKRGEIVAFPTETVYGLGADAWNPAAIRKVFDQKGRPADNPLIVHVASVSMVDAFTDQVSDDAQRLMAEFWPGPLTLIYTKKPQVLDLITAGLQTVAIRWPRHQLAQHLITEVGPLVAPSANTSGKPSPTRAAHVKEDFGDNFPVIDGGKTNIGLESTVLDISRTPYTIYRPGAVSREAIEGVVQQNIRTASPSGHTAVKSPGTKYTHYAPQATVRWVTKDESFNSDDTLYLIHTREEFPQKENIIYYAEDYPYLARDLYDRFRQADHEGYAFIAIEPFHQKQRNPLIPALSNRIEKAVSD